MANHLAISENHCIHQATICEVKTLSSQMREVRKLAEYYTSSIWFLQEALYQCVRFLAHDSHSMGEVQLFEAFVHQGSIRVLPLKEVCGRWSELAKY
jgi:hypothetical protein